MSHTKTAPIPDSANLVKTIHRLSIDGYSFEIIGEHEYKFKKDSKMDFSIFLLRENGNKSGQHFYNRIPNVRAVVKELIANEQVCKDRAIYNHRFDGMDLEQVMRHEDFRYGRIISGYNLPNYVNIYCADKNSPTGVRYVKSCSESEFDRVAAITNNSHNYFIGGEGRRVVEG